MICTFDKPNTQSVLLKEELMLSNNTVPLSEHTELCRQHTRQFVHFKSKLIGEVRQKPKLCDGKMR